jgi:hypothetical protein
MHPLDLPRVLAPAGLVRRRDTRSVLIVPGATALTRMPLSAHSTARCFVSPEATNFAARRSTASSARRLPRSRRDRRSSRPVFDISSIAYLQVREHPAAIHGHDLLPVLRCGLVDVLQRDDAGIRHQDVEPPVALNRRRHHVPRVFGFRDVAHHAAIMAS